MGTFREGKVIEIIERSDDLMRVRVDTGESEIPASAFPSMLGDIEVGDRVVVNTTGIDLGLGTGGEGFVLWNLDGNKPEPQPEGHIMKMRYTPWQTAVLAAEEPRSPLHSRLAAADSVDGMPVVACGLHSQLAGVAAGIKAAAPDARVGYLMTDGAALPLAWSHLVKDLQRAALLDVTCTAGHAFGGELEAVNVFSGLATLCWGAEVDIVIVAMGPGIVGTNSVLGFTGMEQGQALDAASALDGRSIACVRLSFADPRQRHEGVSHHTLTALRVAARERTTVVLPKLSPERTSVVHKQLTLADIIDKHDVITLDGRPGLTLLSERNVRPTSMGRSIDDVEELFLAASAAGRYAAGLL